MNKYNFNYDYAHKIVSKKIRLFNFYKEGELNAYINKIERR